MCEFRHKWNGLVLLILGNSWNGHSEFFRKCLLDVLKAFQKYVEYDHYIYLHINFTIQHCVISDAS